MDELIRDSEMKLEWKKEQKEEEEKQCKTIKILAD